MLKLETQLFHFLGKVTETLGSQRTSLGTGSCGRAESGTQVSGRETQYLLPYTHSFPHHETGREVDRKVGGGQSGRREEIP